MMFSDLVALLPQGGLSMHKEGATACLRHCDVSSGISIHQVVKDGEGRIVWESSRGVWEQVE